MREGVSRFDWHVHTEYSYCSDPPLKLENLLERAGQVGLHGFAVTDHIPHFYFDPRDAWRFRFVSDFGEFARVRETGNPSLRAYIDHVRAYSDRGVLVGAEVEISLAGELIIDPLFLPELDVVIGAVHWLPHLDEPEAKGQFVKLFLDCTLALLDHEIDILAHPTRIFRRADIPPPKDTYEPIIKKAAERDIAVELNCHGTCCNPDADFIKMCVAHGVRLAFSSDTHNLAELGDFTRHRRLLRSLDIPWPDIEQLILTPENLPSRRRHALIGEKQE